MSDLPHVLQCANCARWDREGQHGDVCGSTRWCPATNAYTFPQGQRCRTSFSHEDRRKNMPAWVPMPEPVPAPPKTRRRMLDL